MSGIQQTSENQGYRLDIGRRGCLGVALPFQFHPQTLSIPPNMLVSKLASGLLNLLKGFFRGFGCLIYFGCFWILTAFSWRPFPFPPPPGIFPLKSLKLKLTAHISSFIFLTQNLLCHFRPTVSCPPHQQQQPQHTAVVQLQTSEHCRLGHDQGEHGQAEHHQQSAGYSHHAFEQADGTHP